MKRVFRRFDTRADAGGEVSDEIEFYLDMRAREFMDQGLSPDEARHAARAAFGDVAAIEAEVRRLRAERSRQQHRRDRWRGLAMDARYAIRTLRSHLGFTAAAVATLTLGIGATIAVFTVVNGVLLRPLPYHDPGRIAMVWLAGDDTNGENDELPLSSGFFLDLQKQARSFERLAAFRSWSYTLGEGEPEQLTGARVSPSLFPLLGVRPLAGRVFDDADAALGAGKVAVISYPLWQRRFGGDPAAVGRRAVLSGDAFTIVGVLPAGFAFPRGAELPGGLQFGRRTDVWTPLVFAPEDRTNYGTLNLAAVGRLGAGTSQARAQRELSDLLRRFLKERKSTVRLDYHVLALGEQAGRHVRRSLLVLMGAVALVLAIACANVTSLLLARTAARRREFAVRAALGAGQRRIAQQLIIENGILAAIAASFATLLATAGSRLMLTLVPGSLPRADDISVDWRVLALAVALAFIAAVLFALGAAASVRWSSLAAPLQGAGRMTAGTARQLGRRTLVAGEVALSVTLLIGAALLTRSFVELQRVRPGFDPSHALTAGVLLPIPGEFNPDRDGPRWTSTFTELEQRIARSGGITAVGSVSSLPLTGATESGRVTIVGRTNPPGTQPPIAQYAVVSGAYFAAAAIPLVAGRAFDTRDTHDAAPVAVVNREFARRYLAGQSALGKQVKTFFDFTGGKAERTIVGVVDDVKQIELDAQATPQVYVAQAQMPYPGLTIVVRTPGDPSAAAAVIRRELRAIDPTLAVHDVRTLENVLAESLARQRFMMILIGVFAATALILAVVGLYGVIALSVNQRRREVGVRLALGARPIDVVRLVLREGARLTVTGLVFGIGGALLMSRLVASLLYGVSATEPRLFAAVAVVVAAVSLGATYLPARRASHVDPSVTLRVE